ncbi:MAG TPA: head GIN domain-containing protein [Puia sp.]|nr:head GIN domain-containing protein [Puia sp.]
MTRSNLTNILLLLAFPAVLSSCGEIFGKRIHGNGNVTTQDRPVSNFKNVEVGGAAKVLVSQGDRNSVKIEVDENLQQFVEVLQEGNKVVVRTKPGYNLDPSGDLKIHVTSPVYNDIDASGACDIIGQGTITNPEKMSLHISGAGDMKMELNAPEIDAEVSGSGNVDLKGETKNVDIDLTGAANAHCFDLKSETTKVEISGAGTADVYASVKLSAEVSGAGTVNYKGGGQVDQHVSGAGSIHKAD